MNRLGKKCFIVSIATHGLLILILFVGPAFFAPHDQVVDMPLLDVVPSKLIDAMAQGGGSPQARPPQPHLSEPVRPPVPRQPVVEPERSEPVKEVRHVKSTPDPVEKDNFTPTKHVVEISTQLVKRKSNSTHKKTTTENNHNDSEARREEQLALKEAVSSLKDGLSSSTTVELPHGSGGEAYANYAQAVKTIYEREWNAPDEMVDDDGIAKASIVIQRDGNVLSARVIRSSGNSAVDRSVERALERVKFIAPFPEGSTDSQRTFTISFIKSKHLSG